LITISCRAIKVVLQ